MLEFIPGNLSVRKRQASSLPNITQPKRIEFGVCEGGALYWNGAPVTLAELGPRFAAEARKQPQPELHIHADRHAYYDAVAQVMSSAAKPGLVRIGFVTDPSR